MTSEEIVQALRCCECGECSRCPLYSDKQRCQENFLCAAADLIKRPEKEKAKLLGFMKNGCVACKNWLDDLVGCKISADCPLCTKKECPCNSCTFGSNWEWKGADSDVQADI